MDAPPHAWGPAASAERPELRDVYTVTRLNHEARDLLELSLGALWVEGEVSNLSRPPSGHLYFTLKDASSQVRCALFRNQARLLRGPPRDGQKVLVRARPSLYTARGDFQLLVELLEDYGAGDLRRAFEELKQRLLAEGLFDPARKRPLPAFPRRIGVVTSAAGAALHDILHVLGRRCPSIPVLIYPVAVQGADAAAQIAEAVSVAGERRECDVLILARGGGSLEDFQPFNEEVVARAIAACPIPLVTGVGHEVDFTIADFVADLRAPTPSAAAQAASPDREEWRRRLERAAGRLATLTRARVRREGERLEWLARRLPDPRRRLTERAQRLDGIALRLLATLRQALSHRRGRLAELGARLERRSPRARLTVLRIQAQQLAQRLGLAWHRLSERRQARLVSLGRALEAVSPAATLARGYAIVTRARDGALVSSVTQTAPGDRIRARLADGELQCRVEGHTQTPPGAAREP
jgi:exodeoxyribonuclease VII large subunit